MARKTETTTYKNGDMEFTLMFSQLKPSKSLVFMMYMAKMIGGSASKVIGSFDKGSIEQLSNIKDEDISLEKMGEALSGFLDKLDDDDFIEKMNLLFSSVDTNGEVLTVDHLMFYGEPMLIFKVAYKALGVNYSSFLQGNSVLKKLVKSVKLIKDSKDSLEKQT